MLYALMNGIKVKANTKLPHGKYICPFKDCDNPNMVLKKGRVKIPHFAHLKTSNCQQLSESETSAHLAMKTFVQEKLCIPNAHMEYGQITGVRPDAVWKTKYALELQHSTISITEIQRRNRIYHQNKLTPIWILHGQESSPFFEEGRFFKFHSDFKSFFLNNPPLFDFLHLYRRSFDEDIYMVSFKESNHSKNLTLTEIFGSDDQPRMIVKLSAIELFILQQQGILLYTYFEQEKQNKKLRGTNDNSQSSQKQLDWYICYPKLKSISNYETLFLNWEFIKIQNEMEFEALLMNIRHWYRLKQKNKHRPKALHNKTVPKIPKEVRNFLLKRSKGFCESCYVDLPVKNLVLQPDSSFAIVWEGFKCKKCNRTTYITGWDISLKWSIEEFFSYNLVALTSFYQTKKYSNKEYPEYENLCVFCNSILKKNDISNWMEKLKECENPPGYINKVDKNLADGKIDSLESKEKHCFYFIETKGWDLIVLCPECFITLKKQKNYHLYKQQSLEYWFNKFK